MKKVKIITIILAIILIAAVSFVGIYVQKQNKMENIVKENAYTMELKGARNIRLSVDQSTTTTIKDSDGNEVNDAEELTDEELAEKGYTKEEKKVNSEDVKNIENYETSKKIIENRLQKFGVNEYKLRLNDETGDIVIEIPENDYTDTIVGQLETMGKFEIQDDQTGEVLLNNDDILTANVLYGQNSTSSESGTSVYLNIQFTNDGAKKLESISTEYKTSEDEDTESTDSETEETENETSNEEENSASNEAEEKQVRMVLDDTTLTTTSFSEPLRTGSLQLTVGSASTDPETLQGYAQTASLMTATLSTGNIPVKYEISGNEFIASDITEQDLLIVEGIIAIIAVISLIVLIVKYKLQGLLVAISYIGYAAILLLLIKYTNVILSIEGILGIVIVLILNYIFANKLLAKLKNEELNKENIKLSIKDTYIEFFMKIIPVCILTIVLSFIGWAPVSSFGMVMFWGITLLAVYNYCITSSVIKIKAE